MKVPAKYFDGASSRARDVELDFSDAGSNAGGECGLSVRGEGVDFRVERDGVEVDSKLGRTSRFVRFADGGRCEVAPGDSDLLDAALRGWETRGSGGQADFLHRLESSWKMVLVSAVVLLAGGAAAVWFGLPALAKSIAFSLPEPVVDGLGRHTMEYLDRSFFSPSELDEERQAELREEFGDFLKRTGDVRERRILFRAGGVLGANAFALPSGDIVLTDQLVRLAEDDEELVAVVAHECGHVDGRHVLQSVIQSSALATLVSFMVGDASAVTAIGGALPLFLVQSKFSRGFERDADLYAVRRLRAGGISPARLAEMLEHLSESGKREKREGEGDGAGLEVVEYLGSSRICVGTD